ncbi:MAG: DNA-directed RNA polymerase subunit K [Bryobacteraceae bacterium]
MLSPLRSLRTERADPRGQKTVPKKKEKATKRAATTLIGPKKLTRFERARVVGARALQISMGAPVLLDISPAAKSPIEAVDRRAERVRLGLDPGRRTGLVLFGGQGSRVMLEIARRLDSCGLGLQLILICGRNEKLRRKLGEEKSRLPRFVEGFTTEIPYYMALSDFFIGKPGPGSISEALAMKLPAIVERNAWTLPQERYNADWVVEHGVGMVVPNFRHIGAAVGDLLAPRNFERLRANAGAVANRAVFEIPEILAGIRAAC